MFKLLFFLFLVMMFLWFLGRPFRRRSSSTNRQDDHQSQHSYQAQGDETPGIETQEDRIISYQKKSFEISEAEDVEFKEIKH